MIVRDATALDIETVVTDMRAADAREVYAGRFTDDPAALIADLAAARRYAIVFLALCAGEFDPIALIGAHLRAPGVAAVTMIATDRWAEIAWPATRYVIRTAIPVFLAPNVHRAQCEAWEGNDVSRAWLETLGFEAEGTLQAYGKNRDNFVQYAWLNLERMG